jgi:hypothetical protein
MKKLYKKSKPKKYILLAAIIVIAISVVIFWKIIPYQKVVTAQITRMLEARGVTVSNITLESANPQESVLSNIKLGDANPLTIANLKLQHSPQGLLQGRVNEVSADGVEANIYKENGIWKIGGIETLMQHKADSKGENTLLFDRDSIRKILPHKITINKGNISVNDANFSLAAAYNLLFDSETEPLLNIESNGLTFDKKPYQVNTGAINIAAKLNEAEKKWQGDVVINDINITGLPQEVPPLKLNSYASVMPEKFLATFKLRDASNTNHADLSLTFPPDNPEQGMLSIKSLKFPWGGGIISTKAVNIPFALDKPLPISIGLQEVELSSLLGAISGGKIDGTGKISGTIPLIYYPDGHVTLQEGSAEALEAGVIMVPASMLPGNNPALDIARSALENFHYTSLKIGVYSEGEEKPVIQLTLQGRNPDALEGRPVNLNVKLTGDVLPLLQQSIIPFNDLKHLLDEKKTP